MPYENSEHLENCTKTCVPSSNLIEGKATTFFMDTQRKPSNVEFVIKKKVYTFEKIIHNLMSYELKSLENLDYEGP